MRKIKHKYTKNKESWDWQRGGAAFKIELHGKLYGYEDKVDTDNNLFGQLRAFVLTKHQIIEMEDMVYKDKIK